MEAVIFLLALLVLGLVVYVLVLPIIAIVRTGRIAEISERLRRLEGDVRRLRQLGAAEHPARPMPAEANVVPESPASEAPGAAAGPAVPRPLAPQAGADEAAAQTDWAAVEAWIGGRGLGWAAVVLLVFAAGFFLKHVFERNLIGEVGRVTIGMASGVLLAAGGYRYHRRHWRIFSQMLTAAGIAVLYVSTFASFGYYRLLSQEPASIFLTLLVAEAFLLAVAYEAPAIAVMAVLGGLLAPVLLHTEVDRHRSLFAYLAVLDAGALTLIVFRSWWAVASLALVGTQLLFWAWYSEHYHPAKLTITLLFQVGIFLLFTGESLLSQVVRRRRASLEDLIRLLANALFLAVAAHVLLDDDYHEWMGALALGMAIGFTVQTWLAEWGCPADRPYVVTLLAVAMGFLALVFPLQLDAAWIAVGWAAQGLTLWAFGLRLGSWPVRGLGAGLLGLAALRLVFVDTLVHPAHTEPFIPVLNRYGLPALLIAASLVTAALLVRRIQPSAGSFDFVSMRVLGLAGVLLTWLVLSVETQDYFRVQIEIRPAAQARAPGAEREMEPARWAAYRAERAQDLHYTAQVALSVVWALYAALVLAAGFRFDNRPLRWLALGLFVLTLGKVVLVDMGRLPGFYRVSAFLGLSLMMAAAARGYQKLRHAYAAAWGGKP